VRVVKVPKDDSADGLCAIGTAWAEPRHCAQFQRCQHAHERVPPVPWPAGRQRLSEQLQRGWALGSWRFCQGCRV